MLLDIGLPDIDGHAVAQRMRESPDGVNVVLIAMTGYGQASDRARSKAAGFDHHLVKAVQFEGLLALLSAKGSI